MSYSKKELYNITKRLYKELKEHPDYIVLQKMRVNQGEYDYETDSITLDYRYLLIPTLIHEYLHKWNPDKCETWVLKHEQMIINSLSTLQIKNIIRAFASALTN